MNNILNIINSIQNTQSCSFAYLRYRNEAGELSTYQLLLNVNFLEMYKKDLETLKAIEPKNELEATAKQQLLASIEKSINTEFEHEKSPTKNMTSIHKAIKIHEEKNEIYIHCLVLGKKVIEAGQYKVVNSKELTIVKNQMKKQLKQSKIRFFKLNAEQIKRIAVNKNRIILATE